MPYKSQRRYIWKAIFRSFLIQGSWHYQRMLNLGFLFTLVPFLRNSRSGPIHPDTVRRHKGYFNTHPFMASYIIGAIARMEEDMTFRHKGTDASIMQLKNILSRALGAIGDQLFWRFLRPFAAVAGMVIIFYFNSYSPYNIIAGIGIFLLIFNVPHFWFRIYGMFLGYKYGAILPLHIRIKKIDKPIQLIHITALVGLGLLAWAEGHMALQKGAPWFAAFILGCTASWGLQSTKSIPPAVSLLLPVLTGLLGGMAMVLIQSL